MNLPSNASYFFSFSKQRTRLKLNALRLHRLLPLLLLLKVVEVSLVKMINVVVVLAVVVKRIATVVDVDLTPPVVLMLMALSDLLARENLIDIVEPDGKFSIA